MAFGKNPNNLKQVVPYGGTYAQKAAGATRRPKRQSSGGGKSIPYWADQYKPSSYTPDTIRLIPGEYAVLRPTDDGEVTPDIVPWYEYVEHYHGGLEKGAICSGGPLRMVKSKREPCYGCDIFWEDYGVRKAELDKTGKKVMVPNRVSMRDMFVFNALDMGTFHKMPQVDNRTNQVRMNPTTKEPYWHWVKCQPVGCEGCLKGVESRKGRVQPWAMGRDHFSALNGYADFIGNSCSTCGHRDCITWSMWQCGNPDCGHPVIRRETTTYSPEQLAAVTREPFHCAQCQSVAYLQELIDCPFCTEQGLAPVRAGIFDVDLQVKRQKNQDTNKTSLIIPATSDPKPIAEIFNEIAKPLKLDHRFAPTTLEDQAELFGYTPPVTIPAEQLVKPYQ